MEKIILIGSDQEKSKNLLRWLQLLFPECLIESLPGKEINDQGIFIPDSLGWGE